jgi:hypothetical protein
MNPNSHKKTVFNILAVRSMTAIRGSPTARLETKLIEKALFEAEWYTGAVQPELRI